jgi:protein-disulfide isomerase
VGEFGKNFPKISKKLEKNTKNGLNYGIQSTPAGV